MIRVKPANDSSLGNIFKVVERNGKQIIVKDKEFVSIKKSAVQAGVKFLSQLKSIDLVWKTFLKNIHDRVNGLIESSGTELEEWKKHIDFKINQMQREFEIIRKQLMEINTLQQNSIIATSSIDQEATIESNIEVIKKRQTANIVDIAKDPNTVHAFERKNKFLNQEILKMNEEKELLQSLFSEYEDVVRMFSLNIPEYEDICSEIEQIKNASITLIPTISDLQRKKLDEFSTHAFVKENEHLKKCLLAIIRFNQRLTERKELEENRWDIFNTINRIEFEKTRQYELKKKLKEAENALERKLALFTIFKTADKVDRHQRQLVVAERNFDKISIAHNGIRVNVSTSSQTVVTSAGLSTNGDISCSSTNLRYVTDVNLHVPTLSLNSLEAQEHIESEETKLAKKNMDSAKADVDYWTNEIDLLRQFEEKLITLQAVPTNIISRNNENLSCEERNAGSNGNKWDLFLRRNKGDSLNNIISNRKAAVSCIMENANITDTVKCFFISLKEKSHLNTGIREKDIKQKVTKAILHDYNIKLGFFSKICGDQKNQALIDNQLQRKQMVRVLSSSRLWAAINPEAVIKKPYRKAPLIRQDINLDKYLHKAVETMTDFILRDDCNQHSIENSANTTNRVVLPLSRKLWPAGF